MFDVFYTNRKDIGKKCDDSGDNYTDIQQWPHQITSDDNCIHFCDDWLENKTLTKIGYNLHGCWLNVIFFFFECMYGLYGKIEYKPHNYTLTIKKNYRHKDKLGH